jgi:hypothetical protein
VVVSLHEADEDDRRHEGGEAEDAVELVPARRYRASQPVKISTSFVLRSTTSYGARKQDRLLTSQSAGGTRFLASRPARRTGSSPRVRSTYAPPWCWRRRRRRRDETTAPVPRPRAGALAPGRTVATPLPWISVALGLEGSGSTKKLFWLGF